MSERALFNSNCASILKTLAYPYPRCNSFKEVIKINRGLNSRFRESQFACTKTEGALFNEFSGLMYKIAQGKNCTK